MMLQIFDEIPRERFIFVSLSWKKHWCMWFRIRGSPFISHQKIPVSYHEFSKKKWSYELSDPRNNRNLIQKEQRQMKLRQNFRIENGQWRNHSGQFLDGEWWHQQVLTVRKGWASERNGLSMHNNC
jgi:hypothetical protein